MHQGIGGRAHVRRRRWPVRPDAICRAGAGWCWQSETGARAFSFHRAPVEFTQIEAATGQRSVNRSGATKRPDASPGAPSSNNRRWRIYQKQGRARWWVYWWVWGFSES